MGYQCNDAPKEPLSSLTPQSCVERKDISMNQHHIHHHRPQKLKAADSEMKGALPFLPPAMQSHVLFFSGAAFCWSVLPESFMLRLASSEFVSLLSLHFPLICTVAAIHQFKEGQGQEKEHNNFQWMQQPSRGFLVPSMEETFKDELTDWLRFWMIRAAVEALKSLLAWTSVPPEVKLSLLQMELLFYAWVFTIPLLQTEKITGYAPPSKRPLRILCRRLGKYSLFLVETASSAVPLEWWQNNVVASSTQLFNTLILVKILEQPFADRCLHVIQETRTFVVPGLVTLLAPGFFNQFGVVYVKFVLAVAKSFGGVVSQTSTAIWLQYWVLHASIDAVLFYFSSLWWLIPFSTPGLFCLWYYMTMHQTIERWYTELEMELRQLGLMPSLPGEDPNSEDYGLHQTKTAKILALIWHVLPKASDAGQYGPQTEAEMTNAVDPMEDDERHDSTVNTRTQNNPEKTPQPPPASEKQRNKVADPPSLNTRVTRSMTKAAAASQRPRRSAPSTTGKNDIVQLSHKDNYAHSYKEPPGRKLTRKSRRKGQRVVEQPSKEASEKDCDDNNTVTTIGTDMGTVMSVEDSVTGEEVEIKSVSSVGLDPDETIFRGIGEETIDENQEEVHYEDLLESLLSDDLDNDVADRPAPSGRRFDSKYLEI